MDQVRKKMYCRLCLCSCTVSFDMNYGTPSVKQKIDVCFPDLDMQLVERSRICLECFISLTHSYLLLIRYNYCQKTLNSYLTTTDEKPISLNDVMEGDGFEPAEFKHETTVNRLKDQIEGVMMNMIEMELKNADCGADAMDETVDRLRKELVDEMEQDTPAIAGTEVSEIRNADFYNDVSVESVLDADEDILTEDIDEFCEDDDVKVKMEDLNIVYSPTSDEDDPEPDGELKFTCEDCGVDFPNLPNLARHAKAHKGTECGICGKVLRDRHRLKVHMNGHIKEKFVCEKCGKSYKQKRSMAKHSLVCQGGDAKQEFTIGDES